MIPILSVIMCTPKILQDPHKKSVPEKNTFINDHINVSKKIEMAVNYLHVYSR